MPFAVIQMIHQLSVATILQTRMLCQNDQVRISGILQDPTIQEQMLQDQILRDLISQERRLQGHDEGEASI